MLYHLPDSSRVSRALNGSPGLETVLLASINDLVNILLHVLTDGEKPTSILSVVLGKGEEIQNNRDTDYQTFNTGEEFMRARKAMLDKIERSKNE